MSGGNWEYKNSIIDDIAEDIKSKIENNNKPIPWESLEIWTKQEYDHNKKAYLKNPLYYSQYSQTVLDRFKKAYKALKVASVYAHQLDLFLSGDIGEDKLMSNIKQEIKKIEIL